MTTRNNDIKAKLHGLYGSKVPRLKVFCVSNTDYWEHRYKPSELALPYLRLSEILEVRRHCISMVSDSQFRHATSYIRYRIPALLNEIALWVQSGSGSMSAERSQAIRETLNALESRLRRVIVPNLSAFEE